MTNGFTQFCVERIERESEIISSFYLRPETPLERRAIPGEYLLFDLGEDGEAFRREYSISGVYGDCVRVTIKRETAPQPDLPDGRGSGWFHDRVKPGDRLRAAGPMGQFLLDRASDLPAVLISGGVGLTPLVAMARELGPRGHALTFIHACENGRVHAMGAEIRALAAVSPGMKTHFCYREPVPCDLPGRDYDSTGFLSRGTLEHLLPKDLRCDVYLCGPGGFMQAMYDLLCDIGVAEHHIRFEFFGPATVLRRRQKEAPTPAEMGGPVVVFSKSGLTVGWDAAAPNLLEFAEDQGVMVDFSCRAGSCDSCRTRVLEGEVEYLFEPFERPAAGEALLCCSRPAGNLVLDV